MEDMAIQSSVLCIPERMHRLSKVQKVIFNIKERDYIIVGDGN